MQIPFIDLKSQYLAYKKEIDQAIQRVIDNTSFIHGTEITQLENELSHYTQARHSIACSSGTDALILALMALGIQPGDEVITTAFTFVATAEAICLVGGKPVFVDIKPDTCLIDHTQIEAAITAKTKAIIPVSLFGQTADMDAINAIATKYQLTVIEDAAQSFGATYKNKKSCALSTLACTSFFPAKPLGCYGDGGAVFTSEPALAEKCMKLRNHGQNDQYTYEYQGLNARLDTIQAAVLRVKLKYFAEEVQQRQAAARFYDQLLAEHLAENIAQGEVQLIRQADYGQSVYAQYSLTSKKRKHLLTALESAGVPVKIYYPKPLHQQKPYLRHRSLPVTEQLSQTIFSIPLSPFITREQQRYVVDRLREFLVSC